MTGPQLKQRLRALGLKQIDFLRLVEALAGSAPSPVTMTRWMTGQCQPTPLLVACIALLERMPEKELENLRYLIVKEPIRPPES